MEIITGQRIYQPASEEERLGYELLRRILSDAAAENASDIHLEPRQNETVIKFRVDGELREISRHSPVMGRSLVETINRVAAMDGDEGPGPAAGRILAKSDNVREGGVNLDVRISTFPVVHGQRLVMRLLDSGRIMEVLRGGFEIINLTEEQKADLEMILRRPYGLVIISGPTGSGKTTTAYQALNHLVERYQGKVNIMSLENPVEVIIDGVTQTRVEPEKGFDHVTALRGVMKQDPDVIFLAEVPDLPTLRMAAEAAMNGHLVIVQLNASDAAGALYQFIQLGLEPYFLSMIIEGVTSQRLARRICPHCRQQVKVPVELLESVAGEMGVTAGELKFYRGDRVQPVSQVGLFGKNCHIRGYSQVRGALRIGSPGRRTAGPAGGYRREPSCDSSPVSPETGCRGGNYPPGGVEGYRFMRKCAYKERIRKSS